MAVTLIKLKNRLTGAVFLKTPEETIRILANPAFVDWHVDDATPDSSLAQGVEALKKLQQGVNNVGDVVDALEGLYAFVQNELPNLINTGGANNGGGGTPVDDGDDTPPTPVNQILFNTNYAAQSTIIPPWNVMQIPGGDTSGQTPQLDRVTLVSGANVPGIGTYKPAKALRMELRPGDIWGGTYNRCEVLARNPDGIWNVPFNTWPDPAESERWYEYDVLFTTDFPTSPDNTLWMLFAQWKGYKGGSPPLADFVHKGLLRMAGTKGPAYTTDLLKGTWRRIRKGVFWSDNAGRGWVEYYLDGVNVVPRTSCATMDTRADVGQPDPIYSKIGVYRNPAWTSTQVMYFGDYLVATTKAALDNR